MRRGDVNALRLAQNMAGFETRFGIETHRSTYTCGVAICRGLGVKRRGREGAKCVSPGPKLAHDHQRELEIRPGSRRRVLGV